MPRVGSRSAWLRLGVAMGAVLGLVAVLGFALVPALARHELPPRLSALLGRPVTIDDIGFNPFTLGLVVAGLRVGERGSDGASAQAPALSFARLEIEGSWRSVVEGAPVISGVRLIAPTVRVVRDKGLHYSIDDLVRRWAQRPVSPDDAVPRFSVSNLEIRDGQLEFEDQPFARTHRVSGIDIRLPFVSTLPVHQQVTLEPRVAMRIDDTRIELSGRSVPFSATRQSRIEVSLDAIDLAPYLPYLPAALPVRVLAASVSGKVAVDFGQPEGAAPTLTVTADGSLNGLELREPGGAPLLKLAALQVNGLAMQPLARRFDLGGLVIEAPQLNVQRRVGQTRFAQSVLAAVPVSTSPEPAGEAPNAKAGGASPAAALPASPATPPGVGAPFAWSIGEIVVQNGRIALLDQTVQPKAFALEMESLALRLGRMNHDLAAAVPFEATFALSSGERASASGSLSAQPMRIDADLSVQGVALKQWAWLAAPLWQGELTGGVLSLQSRLQLAQTEDAWQLRLAQLSASLKSLALRQRWDQSELLRLPALAVSGVELDLAARSLAVDRLSVSAGMVQVSREADGQLNWVRALAPSHRSAAAAAAAAAPFPAQTPAQTPAHTSAALSPEPAPQPPWRVRLKQLSVDQFAVGLRDARAAADLDSGAAADHRLDITEISLQAEALDSAATAAPGRVALRTRVGAAGRFDAKGSLGLNPVSAKLRLDARSIALLPVQPYFEPYLNLVVSSGDLSAQGELALDLPSGKSMRAGWRGDVRLADVEAASKLSGEDLLRWRSLQLSGMALALAPLKLDLGQIALSDFYTRLIISPAGRFNLQDLLVAGDSPRGEPVASAPPATAASTSAQAAPALRAAPGALSAAAPAPITIGQITLTNGNIDFSDQFIKPNYSANLTGMSGSVSALAPETEGQLALRGRIDNAGSIEIAGKLNPLAAAPMLDLSARARDIDLPRTSPYSVKYLGYGIDKGKLSATLNYRIEGRQLQADNSIMLDQLTFGDKVDSPDATQLPVLFAVALLKDRHGVIDVNLPIGGSLDDPQFSVGGLVLKVIGNLIVKAVTAPFSLLASLAGAGESLSALSFAPGLAELDPDAQTRLRALAKALADRPALRLDLAGRADLARDGPALRQQALDRQLKAFKLRALPGAGSAAVPGSLDSIRIEPAEYARYLTAAYRAGDFVKPRNLLGMPTEVPLEEMAARLLASISVGPDGIRALANARAQAAKEWLTAQGGIAGERLFLVAPIVDGPPVAAPQSEPVGVSMSLK